MFMVFKKYTLPTNPELVLILTLTEGKTICQYGKWETYAASGGARIPEQQKSGDGSAVIEYAFEDGYFPVSGSDRLADWVLELFHEHGFWMDRKTSGSLSRTWPPRRSKVLEY